MSKQPKSPLKAKFTPGDIVLVDKYTTDNVDIENVTGRITFMYDNSCIVECESIPKDLNNKIVVSYRRIKKIVKAINKSNKYILKNEQKEYWGGEPDLPSSIHQSKECHIKMKQPIRTKLTSVYS